MKFSKKSFFILILVFLFLFSIPSFCSPLVVANFILQKNYPNNTFLATLNLENKSDLPVDNWSLGFNSLSYILEVKDGKIVKQIGKYFLIAPSLNQQSIPTHGVVTFNLRAKGNVLSISDIPNGYFILQGASKNNEKNIISVADKTVLPELKNKLLASTNSSKANLSLGESLVVPLPVALKLKSGFFVLNPTTRLIINDTKAQSAANFLINSILPATNLPLRIMKNSNNQENIIFFTHQGVDSKIGKEGYLLEINSNRIIIVSNTAAGYFYATQTLRQLLPPEIFSHTLQKNIKWSIPALKIVDYPQFSYRGLFIDSARLSPRYIK